MFLLRKYKVVFSFWLRLFWGCFVACLLWGGACAREVVPVSVGCLEGACQEKKSCDAAVCSRLDNEWVSEKRQMIEKEVPETSFVLPRCSCKPVVFAGGQPHPDILSSVAFSPTGKRLLVSSPRVSVSLWEREERVFLLSSFQKIRGSVGLQLNWSPTGKYFYGFYFDENDRENRLLESWLMVERDFYRSNLLIRYANLLKTQTKPCVGFFREGVLAFCGRGRSLVSWSFLDGKKGAIPLSTGRLGKPKPYFFQFASNKKGTHFVAESDNGRIAYGVSSPPSFSGWLEDQTLGFPKGAAHKGEVRLMSFGASSRYMVSFGKKDSMLKVWDVQAQRLVVRQLLQETSSSPIQVAMDRSDSRVALLYPSKVIFYSLATGTKPALTPFCSLPTPSNRNRSFALAPDASGFVVVGGKELLGWDCSLN